MANAILLPIRGALRYTGKYPHRLRMYSSSGSGGHPAHERHIHMKSFVFVELNNGSRYYIDTAYLKSLLPDSHRHPRQSFDFTPVIEGADVMSQEAYDEMLKDIEEDRKYRAKCEKRVKYRQEGGDDGYCYVVRVDGFQRWNGLTRSEARYYKDKEVDNLMAKRNR